MRLVLMIVVTLLSVPALAGSNGGEGPAGFDDRPGVGHPVIFRDETGGAFRPRNLVVVTAAGSFAAALPATNRNARSEDRIDLSELPILGEIFRDRRAPSDVERDGDFVGVVYRAGHDLVLDAPEEPGPFDGARVILTANFPRDGTLSFDLGRVDYRPSAAVAAPGARVGAAYIYRDALVIAADGGRPLITDWDLF